MYSNKNSEGRYIYCIVESDEKKNFGQVGIEDNLVYTLPTQKIDAVIQCCEPKLYKTESKEKTSEWLLTHQYVLDLAAEEFETVIPLAFNTIFIGDDETVRNWLNARCQHIRGLLEWLKGKQQYGIQIFFKNDFVRETIGENIEIQRCRRALEANSFGAAFLLKNLKEKESILVNDQAKKMYTNVKALVDDVRIEPTPKEISEKLQDNLMILNLSCLVHKNKLHYLANTLRHLNQQKGLSVRFTGPWPPYSFVSGLKNQKSKFR